MTPDEGTRLLRELTDVFSDLNASPEKLSPLITRDYAQHVDGRTLDHDGFLDHAVALRGALKSMRFEIEHIVSDGEAGATVHTVHFERRSGETGSVRVHAFYRFRDGRLCLVDEVTTPLSGGRNDRELGSLATAADEEAHGGRVRE